MRDFMTVTRVNGREFVVRRSSVVSFEKDRRTDDKHVTRLTYSSGARAESLVIQETVEEVKKLLEEE